MRSQDRNSPVGVFVFRGWKTKGTFSGMSTEENAGYCRVLPHHFTGTYQ